ESRSEEGCCQTGSEESRSEEGCCQAGSEEGCSEEGCCQAGSEETRSEEASSQACGQEAGSKARGQEACSEKAGSKARGQEAGSEACGQETRSQAGRKTGGEETGSEARGEKACSQAGSEACCSCCIGPRPDSVDGCNPGSENRAQSDCGLAFPDRFASEVIGGRCGAGRVFLAPPALFQWRGICRAASVFISSFFRSASQKAPDAFNRLCESRHIGGVGETQMLPRRVAAKIQPRCDGDAS
ncbi:MAG: hypothetical protein QG619_2611, partial [Pseudomonadota bacterium]|nr:hypothetical protein [Pseudomonadota bacterium]